MKKLIKASVIKGVLRAPASKSYAQRSILLASQLNSPSYLNLGDTCDDIMHCSKAVESLGASVEWGLNSCRIVPNSKPLARVIDCGESGTCFRLISALAAKYDFEFELQAHGSLRTRPMTMVEEALSQLAVKVTSQKSLPPLTIRGPIRSAKIEVDGYLSSQLLSGLLLALPFADGSFQIAVKNLKSKPYVKLTLELLQQIGVQLDYTEDLSFFNIVGNQVQQGFRLNVEGDWSSAATMLVAGAIAGELTMQGVSVESKQADSRVLLALKSAGCLVENLGDEVKVSRGVSLNAFDFDASDCPDSIPILVALAVNCQGRSRILGADRLKHKESDRASALCEEYAKLGAKVVKEDSAMVVEGSELSPALVYAHNDHRIAMSLALAGLNIKEGLEIDGAEVVAKSYPKFFEDLHKVGAHE